MAIVSRESLEPMLVGVEAKWSGRVVQSGANLNLSTGTGAPYTITAVASCVDTGDQNLTVTCANATQTGDDVGKYTMTIAAAVLTAAREGEWNIDVFIAASGGNRQPLVQYRFTLRPVETEA